MAPKPETEITTEVTTLEEKTENQPDDKPNVLPITQMRSLIPKRTFCRFMVISNTVRCFPITDNHRNNRIEKGNKTSMTPKPKTTITTEAEILIENTENPEATTLKVQIEDHSEEKPMSTQMSTLAPKEIFCRFWRTAHCRY